MSESAHVFDVTTDNFEAEVLQKSLQTPVLVDFWAPWCGPCKTLGPMLEKLAAEYNGAFLLAKVDVDQEQQVAAAFQIRSVPTVFLIKDGQIADGFPGVIPEGQLREFLTQHGVEPLPAVADEVPGEAEPLPLDPLAEVAALREAISESPDKPELKLDLALALLKTAAVEEASVLLDALPANLSTDDRAVRARARLDFSRALNGAPDAAILAARVQADDHDLQARYLLGIHQLLQGEDELALIQFIEMLRLDRSFQEGLPKKALIDAFRVIEDADLVGRYRRRMSSLLF